MNEKPSAKRGTDNSIQTLRGISVILLVLFHSILVAGSRAGDSVYYERFTQLFDFIRMPLFTFISGYVYSLKRVSAGNERTFIRGKARRILIPCFSVILIRTILEITSLIPLEDRHGSAILVTGGRPIFGEAFLDGLANSFFFHPVTFWYLQAVFVIFVVAVFIDKFGLMDSFRAWAATLAAAALLNLCGVSSTFFSIDGVAWLGVYFIFGCGIQRFSSVLFQTPFLFAASIAGIMGLVAQQLGIMGYLNFPMGKHHSVVALVTGCSWGLLLFRYRRNIPWLTRLGGYSYSIFLFHRFAFILSALIVAAIPMGSHTLLRVVVFLILGLVVPIIMEKVFSRFSFFRLFLLGLRQH